LCFPFTARAEQKPASISRSWIYQSEFSSDIDEYLRNVTGSTAVLETSKCDIGKRSPFPVAFKKASLRVHSVKNV